VSFGFLDAINCARTLFNFKSNHITFARRIQTPNIPIQNIPVSSSVAIHRNRFLALLLHPTDPIS
jgi:hypothetical protein